MHLNEVSISVHVVYAVWVPIVAFLFWKLGPVRAAPIAVFAAFLLLPRVSPVGPLNKRAASGLALLVGVLVSDRRALLRFRPSLVDSPMIAFLLMPLASGWSNHFEQIIVTIRQVYGNAFEWGMPYLMGRLYFGDRDGPRRLSIAVVVAGLCYVPPCVYEMVAGPDNYLLGRIYGEGPHLHMVKRLGGWRPEVFLTNGIELSAWMAMASTVAFWLWLRRAWTLRIVPAWMPAAILAAVTIASRGVYGYLTLALGWATAPLTHALRTRWLMVALTLVLPAYVVVRVAGLWDGQALVELASQVGSGESVAFRLRAEEAYVEKTFGYNPAFGLGGNVVASRIYDRFLGAHLWSDGWWAHEMRGTGIIGLVVFALAFFLVPTWLALSCPSGRTWGTSPDVLAWGLALFLILHLFDSLHNMAFLTPSTLIGGSLAGRFLGRRPDRLEVPDFPRPSDSQPPSTAFESAQAQDQP